MAAKDIIEPEDLKPEDSKPAIKASSSFKKFKELSGTPIKGQGFSSDIPIAPLVKPHDIGQYTEGDSDVRQIIDPKSVFSFNLGELSKIYSEKVEDLAVKKQQELHDSQWGVVNVAKSGVKFLGKTAARVGGGLVGSVWGLARLGTGNSFWEGNQIFDITESAVEGLEHYLPVYSDPNYQDYNFFEKALYNPTKFLDQTTDALSFVAAAVLTDFAAVGAFGAVGRGLGLSRVGATAKGMKSLKGIGKLDDMASLETKLASNANALNSINRYKNLAGTSRALLLGSAYESSIEANETFNQVKESLISEFTTKNGRQPSQSELEDIENKARTAGNFTFGVNMLVVGFGNMVQLPSLFMKGYNAEKKILNSTRKGLKDLDASKLKKATLATTTVLKSPVSEAFEELAQSYTSNIALEYWGKQYNPEFTGDALTTFGGVASKGWAELWKSQQGGDSIGMGFLVGMLGLPGVSIKDGKVKLGGWTGGSMQALKEYRKEIEKYQDIAKGFDENKLKDRFSNFVREGKLQEEMDEALEKGDINTYKNLENDKMFNYIRERVKYGMGDLVRKDLDDAEALPLDKFIEEYGLNTEEEFTEEDRKKSIQKARNYLDLVESKSKNIDALVSNLFPGEEMNELKDALVYTLASLNNADVRESELLSQIEELTKSNINASEIREAVKNSRKLTRKALDSKVTERHLEKLFGVKATKSYNISLNQTLKLKELLNKKNKSDKEIAEMESIQKSLGLRPAELEKAMDRLKNISKEEILDIEDKFAFDIESGLIEVDGKAYNDFISSKLKEWGNSDISGYVENKKEVNEKLIDLLKINMRKATLAANYNSLFDPELIAKLNELKTKHEDAQKEKASETLEKDAVKKNTVPDTEKSSPITKGDLVEFRGNLYTYSNSYNKANGEVGHKLVDIKNTKNSIEVVGDDFKEVVKREQKDVSEENKKEAELKRAKEAEVAEEETEGTKIIKPKADKSRKTARTSNDEETKIEEDERNYLTKALGGAYKSSNNPQNPGKSLEARATTQYFENPDNDLKDITLEYKIDRKALNEDKELKKKLNDGTLSPEDIGLIPIKAILLDKDGNPIEEIVDGKKIGVQVHLHNHNYTNYNPSLAHEFSLEIIKTKTDILDRLKNGEKVYGNFTDKAKGNINIREDRELVDVREAIGKSSSEVQIGIRDNTLQISTGIDEDGDHEYDEVFGSYELNEQSVGGVYVSVITNNGTDFPLRVFIAGISEDEASLVFDLMYAKISGKKFDDTLDEDIKEQIKTHANPRISGVQSYLDLDTITYNELIEEFVFITKEGKRKLFDGNRKIHFGDRSLNKSNAQEGKDEFVRWMRENMLKQISLKRIKDNNYKEHIMNNGYILSDAQLIEESGTVFYQPTVVLNVNPSQETPISDIEKRKQEEITTIDKKNKLISERKKESLSKLQSIDNLLAYHYLRQNISINNPYGSDTTLITSELNISHEEAEKLVQKRQAEIKPDGWKLGDNYDTTKLDIKVKEALKEINAEYDAKLADLESTVAKSKEEIEDAQSEDILTNFGKSKKDKEPKEESKPAPVIESKETEENLKVKTKIEKSLNNMKLRGINVPEGVTASSLFEEFQTVSEYGISLDNFLRERESTFAECG